LNIYIAGWFGAKERLRQVRDRIEKVGCRVVGTWLDEETGAPEAPGLTTVGDVTPEQCREYAVRDYYEVTKTADILILDTIDVNPRGGREVEYGMALAAGLTLWVVGPRRNVFHYIAHRHFPTWDGALGALENCHRRRHHERGESHVAA
jgi:hypothetical protein